MIDAEGYTGWKAVRQAGSKERRKEAKKKGKKEGRKEGLMKLEFSMNVNGTVTKQSY